MKKIKNIILLILCILFIIISYLVSTGKIEPFDTYIYEIIVKLRSDNMTKFMKFMTNFADYRFMIFMIIVFVVVNKAKLKSITLLFNSLNSTVINKILKEIFKRRRPTILKLISQGGYSFPSGHSSAAMIFYGTIIYFVITSKLNNKLKIIYVYMLLIIILLIGVSRVYLGVHYASDVLAGYIVSFIYLIISFTFIKEHNT